MCAHNLKKAPQVRRHRAGVTLVELMVALAIGSFLIIGAVTVATQSRQAFLVNESIAKVQETAQFAIDTIEADLRMASNWGQTSRSDAIDGRATDTDPDPYGVLAGGAAGCGATWALDLTRPIEGSDSYVLPCPANAGAQPNSDVVTIRRATVDPEPPVAGRVQIQSTRVQGRLFNDDVIPAGYDATTSATHSLLVNSYYVAADSTLIPGVPTLRRKSLAAGGPTIVDLEVAPGVENLQLQFGVDTDQDNDVDRYVNPGAAILDPDDAAFLPAARIMTARIWLVIRSIDPEPGIVQPAGGFSPGNVDLGVPDDSYRRLQVSKTILLRNART